MQNKRRLSSAIICAVMLIALVMVPLFALSASAADANEPATVAASGSWVKKDISKISSTDIVVITMTTKAGVTYGIVNDNGTSSAPDAVKLDVSDEKITSTVEDNLKWNIVNSGGDLTIHPNGDTSKWLYTTAANNGTRVGTNSNKTFVIDADTGYLKHTGTNRYLGVYTTKPDWRCYTNTTGNTANQTLAFYVWTEAASTDCKHINTTTTTVDATCTAAGSTTVTCQDCKAIVSTENIAKLPHEMDNGVETTAPTCKAEGVTTYSCANCDYTETEPIDKIAHSYEGGVCTACGKSENAVSFTFGEDGDAGHKDTTTSKTTYDEEVDEYTLSLTDGTKMYPGSLDAKGNSCVKLGTGSATGGFNFTVPDDVVSVVIYVAGYKDDTAKIQVNGVNYTVNELSDNGEYMEITVDTTTNKTVSFTTVSGGYRCMVNGIDFVPAKQPEAPEYTEPTITGAKVNVGEDLAIKYLVYLPEGTDLENVILKVTNEGHGTYAELEGTLVEDGTYVFVYDNIAPQCMSDLLDAYLIIDGETVATVEDYSIVQNAKNLANDNPEDTELKQFLADLLAYGRAAQLYVSGEAVITDADIAEIGAAGTKAPTADTKDLGERVEGAAYIAGAGVRFDSEIQMFVLVSGDATVKVGGVEYEVVDGKAYLPAMSLTALSESVVIELYVGDTPVHTVTYGVYDYVYSMIGSDDTVMATLALALYNCAESAKAYLD